jgi:GNAT superfamily N-acetyltransferase
MDAPVHIRVVTERDFDQWKPLWDGYNAFYGRAGDTALPEHITRLAWSRFLEPSEPMHALVAEKDGQLLGLAHYLYHRSTTNPADSCYLQDLFTRKEARGMGVGQALIKTRGSSCIAICSDRFGCATPDTDFRSNRSVIDTVCTQHVADIEQPQIA